METSNSMIKSCGLVSLIIMVLGVVFSCKNNPEPIAITANDFHKSVDKVIEIMVYDIFSPPVASRVFVYPNIAAYEIIAQGNDNYTSLNSQIHHLGKIPLLQKTEGVNYKMAALIAHIEMSKRLIFSKKEVEKRQDSLYKVWSSKNNAQFQASKTYALKVTDFIYEWMSNDNYAQTRTMPGFTVVSENEERWRPTPPAYMDGLEPNWKKIRTFVLDTASQFKPLPPPKFSMEKSAVFYKELKTVYDVSKEIKEKGDTSEELAIAQFWDCNPYVSVTKGHLMFALKKITPGAHWIGIAKIACKTANTDFDKTIFAYTKTSIAIADAFISCWDEKYRSNLVRPETLINTYIDDKWEPVLQTPPFPEYTSGHSVVSAAAAKVLTNIFGENFTFKDDTETIYGLPIRSFSSFNTAAKEAAISRLYGGIHYKFAVDLGFDQGEKVGDLVNERLQMKE